MENRRQPSNNPPKASNLNNNSRDFEKKPFGSKSFHPRENQNPASRERFEKPTGNFQASNEKFQPRENRRPTERFQPSVAKFQPNERFAPKNRPAKPWERDQPLPRVVSEMQITDGRHRGKYLTATASPNVLPTARRVRETMFRILYRRVRAGRFLDLCAGSGMVGIEAISRGALLATFVERSARSATLIKKNLEVCGIKEGHGEVVEKEVIPFLKQMHKRRRQWDVVYFDPPYDADYDEAVAYFARGAAVKPKGVLVIEHRSDKTFPEKFGVMTRWRVLEQGETTLSFYERK